MHILRMWSKTVFQYFLEQGSFQIFVIIWFYISYILYKMIISSGNSTSSGFAELAGLELSQSYFYIHAPYVEQFVFHVKVILGEFYPMSER